MLSCMTLTEKTQTSTTSLMRVSDFLLSVTCSGVSADMVAAYLALASARLPRLDSEVVEPLLNKSSSLVRLRFSYNTCTR